MANDDIKIIGEVNGTATVSILSNGQISYNIIIKGTDRNNSIGIQKSMECSEEFLNVLKNAIDYKECE